MASISVPEQVFPGFKIINSLSEDELDSLISYLKNLEIGKFYGDIARDLSELLKVDGDELWKALLSFTELTSNESDYSILAKNLAESYKELSRIGINTKEVNKLKANLLHILSSFENVLLSEKVREYRIENSNNLMDFKLLTDIRLLMKDDNSPDDKLGIVLHKFYIEYQSSNPRNELHLHLSLKHLIELKEEIEKAISRDRILRENYSGNIKLI